MPVTVVAVFTPKPGETARVLDAFAEVSPRVHREAGCEFYAAHTDGDSVVMVERWDTRADLDAHASGAPLARLNELTAGSLVRPYDVWLLDSVPLGDPAKGTIPSAHE